MEILSMEFLSALLAIVMIDLVLAGDNAIVIALAARNLPASQKQKAILWGTVGAIAVRTAMTLVVVWLLKVPGLMLAGGALLVWIAYKLLTDKQDESEHVSAADNFWGAMKTIVIADAVMGLDNVLAVAGAAHGSFLLVVLGLLISVPIMIWGSQLILKFVERYPAIIYIGGGVLAWTAATMITHEPMIKPFAEANGWFSPLVIATVMLGVLGGGYFANAAHARRNVAEHLVKADAPAVAADADAAIAPMKNGLRKVLVPIDASGNSVKAVQHVLNRVINEGNIEVHLVHVRPPLSRYISRFLQRGERERFHRTEAEKALEPARSLLNRHSIPHAVHIELGEKPAIINRLAQRLHADEIVIGTARKNSLTRFLEDSVTNRILELVQVPVQVIVGEEVSKVEKYGLPAGLGAALVLLFAANE